MVKIFGDSHKVWAIVGVAIAVILLGSIFVYIGTREEAVFGKAMTSPVEATSALKTPTDTDAVASECISNEDCQDDEVSYYCDNISGEACTLTNEGSCREFTCFYRERSICQICPKGSSCIAGSCSVPETIPDLETKLVAEETATNDVIIAAAIDPELQAKLEATATVVEEAKVAFAIAEAGADLKAEAEAEAKEALEAAVTSTNLQLKVELEAKVKQAAEELATALSVEAAAATDLQSSLEIQAQTATAEAALTINTDLQAKLEVQAETSLEAVAEVELMIKTEAEAVVDEETVVGPPQPPLTPNQDTDGDGVLDANEPAVCWNTPAGKVVESNGCLVGDLNQDGKVNELDAAPASLKQKWEELNNLVGFNQLIKNMIANWGSIN